MYRPLSRRHFSPSRTKQFRPRQRNPFPKLETPLDEAATLVEIITKNAEARDAGTPILNPALAEAAGYPPEMFTPLNIAAASVKPKISQQLLDLFLGDPLERQGKSGFYRSVVEGLEAEEGGEYDYHTGNIPDIWKTPRKRLGKERPSPLQEAYNLLQEDYANQGYPATYSEFEEKLSQKRKAQRQLQRRQRKRRGHRR